MFEQELISLEFKTKKQAKEFRQILIDSDCRIENKPTLRKSLPKFHGHINRGYSVWYTPFALSDALQIIKIARQLHFEKSLF